MSALQMFRSCTASLSSRAIAARSNSRHLTGVNSRRCLSSETRESSSPTEGSEQAKAAEGEKSEPDPTAELSGKLKAKEAEVVDLTSRLRYLQADFLNLQRNAAREKEQQRDFAITRFASDLLETVDVLSLALKSIPQSALKPPAPPSSSPSPETPPSEKSADTYLNELYTGVELTQRLLQQTLFKYHVKPFDPTDDKFDPNRHEALYQAPVPGKEPGTVINCQKIGYTIKDRILRAAQVGVAQESQS